MPPPQEIVGNLRYSFTCGGQHFYEFADSSEMPAARALAAAEFLEQYAQRTNREYLDMLYTGILAAVDKQKTSDIVQLVSLAKSRLDDIVELETAYKLATAYFLIPGEDQHGYSPGIGNYKIKLWKDNDKLGFFLREPIKKLLGFMNVAEAELEKMIAGACVKNDLMLDSIGRLESFSSGTSELKAKWQSLKETYSQLRSYAN